MLWDIVNILIGLIGGFASGFYFERRGSRAAREQHEATLRSNEELRAYIMELEQSQSELQGRMAQMQESVYSAARSGEPQPRRGVAELDPQTVLAELHARVDAHGRVSVAPVRSVFLAAGHSPQEFEAVIAELVRTEIVRIEGKSLEFT
ncbi:MAG: hypothetical protein KDB25_07160 [Leucobacter sp.]|nr:hypothetical protein [Leucobacter sp.]